MIGHLPHQLVLRLGTSDEVAARSQIGTVQPMAAPGRGRAQNHSSMSASAAIAARGFIMAGSSSGRAPARDAREVERRRAEAPTVVQTTAAGGGDRAERNRRQGAAVEGGRLNT